jgi:hypothetical protein
VSTDLVNGVETLQPLYFVLCMCCFGLRCGAAPLPDSTTGKIRHETRKASNLQSQRAGRSSERVWVVARMMIHTGHEMKMVRESVTEEPGQTRVTDRICSTAAKMLADVACRIIVSVWQRDGTWDSHSASEGKLWFLWCSLRVHVIAVTTVPGPWGWECVSPVQSRPAFPRTGNVHSLAEGWEY